jgi:hypothetical protein
MQTGPPTPPKPKKQTICYEEKSYLNVRKCLGFFFILIFKFLNFYRNLKLAVYYTKPCILKRAQVNIQKIDECS